jgi:2-polyprenyl-3-methyl-5-hydroxy-6-metoxy-1,4-benzoquinol methylase
MKILVAIASYGTRNDRYLARIIEEYRSMSFEVDIVVLSNISKQTAAGVELLVGLPTKNPWSLPFGHKKLFADRIERYDLFIYSEDDTMITERNIRAFCSVTSLLPDAEIAGLFRFERDESGNVNYPEIHGHFHWNPQSVRSRGGYTLAHFTNEHSACYIVTQRQLRFAINSGGFLVGTHEGKYDMLCTAATDPYTQCGLQRLICISHIDEFLVEHLSSKYIGSRFGVNDVEFRRQIEVLLKLQDENTWNGSLLRTETRLKSQAYSKDFYTPVCPDIIAAIPKSIRNVLSIGCGWGAIEGKLLEMGMRVVAVPLDCVISGAAAARGVEIINGDFSMARNKLSRERFDCLLLDNVLHLVEDPVSVLSSFGELLDDSASVYIVIPNMFRLSFLRWKLLGDDPYRGSNSYERNGTHFSSQRIIRKWLKYAGIKHERTMGLMGPRAQRASRLTFGLMDSLLHSELLAIATKR